MFKDYLKAWFNYRNDNNVMSLRTLTTLKTEIQQDLFDAFEMAESVISEHPDLFDPSSSFVDFLFRLLDVSPPKQSFVKKGSDTIQSKLDNINASLNDIVREHKRLIGEVDKTYKTNKEAFEKGEEVLTTNLGQLTSIVAEFNEHFQKIKQMTDKFKQKIQDQEAIEYPETSQKVLTLEPNSKDTEKGPIPLSYSENKTTPHLSELDECNRKLNETQNEYDKIEKELNTLKLEKDKIKKELDTLKLEKNNNYKNEDFKSLTEENTKLKYEQEQLQRDFETIINTLPSMKDVQTDIFKKIQKKLSELLNQKQIDHETELKRCNDKINNLQQEHEKQFVIKTEKTELQTKASELETQIKDFLKEKQNWENTLAALRNTKSDLELQLENKSVEMDNITKEIEKLKIEINTLQSNLRQKDETIKKLQSESQSKTMKFENQLSLLKAEQHAVNLSELSENVKNQNEKLQLDLEKIKTENGTFSFELQSLKEKYTKLQKDYEAGEKENEQISKNLIDLRREMIEKQNEIHNLESLLTKIQTYVASYYGIKVEEESSKILQCPKWLNNWIDKDTLYHRYVTSLQNMFQKMFSEAVIVDFTDNITEEKVNFTVKAYEKLIESHHQHYILLTSQVESLKSEIQKFKIFDPSIEISTERYERRTFDRQSKQMEKNKRNRSRSPFRRDFTQKIEQGEITDEDVEIIEVKDQNWDIVRESIQNIYEEHEEMSKCINIILKRNDQTEMKDYLSNIEQKVAQGTESQHYLHNIASILTLQLNYLETIENLNIKYEKCRNVLLSFAPTKNIKMEPDAITTENEQIDQTNYFIQNLVDEHDDMLWFINLAAKQKTTKELNDIKKQINDMKNEKNENRIKLFLKIIDTFLNHETLVTTLEKEIDAINDIYTLKNLNYDKETQTLILSEPIISEITLLRSESEQRLSEIKNELLPNIATCKKQIDKLKQLNQKLNRYRKFFLPVQKELNLKSLSLMKAKEYRILTNKLSDMMKLYSKVQNKINKLRDQSPTFKYLTTGNFMETFESMYESPFFIRDFYANYILKILSFQQNLPILEEPVSCAKCKNWIDIPSTPYRFQCNEKHIFHNPCLESILKSDLKCSECNSELFPDLKYFNSIKKRSLSSPNKRAKLDYVEEFEDELVSKDKIITELKRELEQLKDKLLYDNNALPTFTESTVFETSGEDRSTEIQQTTNERVNEKWLNIIYLLSVMYYKLYERSRTERELLEKVTADKIIENLEKISKRVKPRFDNSTILNLLFDFFVKHAQILTNRPIELLETETRFASEKAVVDYIISNLRDYYETKQKEAA